MNRLQRVVLLVLVGWCLAPWGAFAQVRTDPPPAPGDAASGINGVDDAADTDRAIDVVRIGQGYTLRAGERAGDVVVIGGDAQIDGQVDGDLVVILGTLRVGASAVLDQQVTTVAGHVTVAPGATLRRDIVVVGGGLDAPEGIRSRRGQVIIDPSLLGMHVGGVLPWVTRGLAMGRLIVPDQRWIWFVVTLVFVVYLLVNLVADTPVRSAAATLLATPLTAFGAGLLVLLLLGPLSALLAISIVGIAVIPFLLCAVLAAGLVGKVAALRWIGMTVIRDAEPTWPLRATVAFVVGFVLATLIYMVPVIGLASWALLGVVGLGAVTMALIEAYRREHPSTPLPPMPPPPPMPEPGLSAQPLPPVPPVPPPAPAAVDSVASSAAVMSFPRAAFKDRLAAVVLDVILVAIAVQFLGPFRPQRVFFLGLLVYHVAFWTWKQTTVGGIICHLRVVRAGTGTLSFADALVRGLSAIFSMAVAGLGLLWILKEPDRLAWHDKIAGTYVVRVPQQWPV